MIEQVKLSSVETKHIYLLLLKSFLKKPTNYGQTLRYRIDNAKAETITLVKGPFAHKKSKEQFTTAWTRVTIKVHSPIFTGLASQSSSVLSTLSRFILEHKVLVFFHN